MSRFCVPTRKFFNFSFKSETIYRFNCHDYRVETENSLSKFAQFLLPLSSFVASFLPPLEYESTRVEEEEEEEEENRREEMKGKKKKKRKENGGIVGTTLSLPLEQRRDVKKKKIAV